MFNKLMEKSINKITDMQVQHEEKIQRKEEVKQKIKTFEKTINIDLFNKLYINDSTREWYYPNKNYLMFSYDNIVQVDVVEDEETTTLTKTKGTDKRKVSIVKGAIGMATLGPVGAVIGGSQGKIKKNAKSISKDIDYCTNLSICITLNIIDFPTLEIPLLNTKTDKKSLVYKNAKKKATELMSLFSAIINIEHNNQDVELTESTEDKYEKLIKLKNLFDNGIISQEEFEKEKQNILK